MGRPGPALPGWVKICKPAGLQNAKKLGRCAFDRRCVLQHVSAPDGIERGAVKGQGRCTGCRKRFSQSSAGLFCDVDPNRVRHQVLGVPSSTSNLEHSLARDTLLLNELAEAEGGQALIRATCIRRP